jgi:hypothetical protein
MDKVIAVQANDDFSLELRFRGGTVKVFDVKPYLDYEVFRELGDLNYFKQVTVAFGAVQWPHEQDISPETLYLEGTTVTAATLTDSNKVA